MTNLHTHSLQKKTLVFDEYIHQLAKPFDS